MQRLHNAYLAACAAAVALAATSAPAADTGRFWELTPYQIDIVIAADLQGANAEALAKAVVGYVERRIDTAIGPLWSATVSLAEGAERHAVLSALRSGNPTAPPGLREDSDKWMVIAVWEDGAGVHLAGAEQDRILNTWGRSRSADLSSANQLGEAVFQLACDIFAPIATFSIDSDDPNRVELSLRGGQLSSPTPLSRWVGQDDVFRTVLMQMDRSGLPVEGGTQEVLWTYLVTRAQEGAPTGESENAAPEDESTSIVADVFSHTRRPFGVRRRGRVDQLAIRLPRTKGPSELRLVSRGDSPRPLVGYEVFAQDGTDPEKKSIGKSGLTGAIAVPPGESPIQTVWVKSGSQLAAKIPIATGADPLIVAPLLDESKRLDAEARLGLLREQLIDLVALRTIFAARIDKAIEAGDLDQARGLLLEFRKLQGRAEFNARIDREEEQCKADDPVVQQRIDKLFTDMKSVLGAFLGGDDINKLERRLDRAKNKPAETTAATP
ncbi:hypothetical protein Pla175_21010 [Pirellulimonas nuda]|uniref:Uncharacterized protein n=1 Tax=Pirellulimonas nuda TaxID=2528009 RepID=A0A518DB58_9BACT|nr:hypothetical protein [Pirellulimonas nuda]QDU88720.1 hypothetical protein Pla175_21010 [Pirellulimonas nuda]